MYSLTAFPHSMHLVPQFFRHLVTHVRAKGMYEKMYHISAKNWDATATMITSGPHAAFLTSLSRQANICAHEPSLQAELEKNAGEEGVCAGSL